MSLFDDRSRVKNVFAYCRECEAKTPHLKVQKITKDVLKCKGCGYEHNSYVGTLF